MLVLGCNTLHALDNSLYIRLADEEGEHAMIEVDRMDAGASGDGCVWDFSRLNRMGADENDADAVAERSSTIESVAE